MITGKQELWLIYESSQYCKCCSDLKHNRRKYSHCKAFKKSWMLRMEGKEI